MQILKSIAVERASVNGDFGGVGFFLADAVEALGDFGRASRALSALTKRGAVFCKKVEIGGTSHDFYAVSAWV